MKHFVDDLVPNIVGKLDLEIVGTKYNRLALVGVAIASRQAVECVLVGDCKSVVFKLRDLWVRGVGL